MSEHNRSNIKRNYTDSRNIRDQTALRLRQTNSRYWAEMR